MFFDDLHEGFTFRTGARTLPRDEILDFARRWDPQPFHVDEDAAAGSIYGGLIASGYHTLLTAFVLTLEAEVWTEASMGSPGMDELRWLKPVRPGDTLHVRGQVRALTPSASKPDRGIARIFYEVLRGDEAVMHWTTIHLLRRRLTE